MKNKYLLILLSFVVFSCDKNWSYEGRNHPQSWGDLQEDYKFCKIGYNQAPIDITEEFKPNDLQFFYKKADVEKVADLRFAKFEFDSRDYLIRTKKKYYVRRFEFHHPSEHLINHEPSSLEMQIYHKSDDEQWLVLAIMLEVGAENKSFEQFLKVTQNGGQIDLNKFVNKQDSLFFYDGSQTTPPCREGVKWYVMKTPIKISKEQMNEIIKSTIFVKSNARPVQKYHPEKY